MAYYTCGSPSCRFTFWRTEEPDACPDCGKSYILKATGEEVAAHKKNREEYSGKSGT